MAEISFQPFADRLSRDIRNDLSASLMDVIGLKTLTPAEKTAERYLKTNPARCYRDYISERLRRYSRVLPKITAGPDDPLFKGLILWDEQLFFEVHEILEHAWLHSHDEEKGFLQAMIRAAGVYIKRDAGFPEPAARIAAKAIPILEKNRKRLSQYTEPQLLIDALQHLGSPPPKLLAG